MKVVGPELRIGVGRSNCGMSSITASLSQAKDLSKQPPRSPRQRLDGYVIMARMIDKGRAAVNGTVGEYHFNCSLDNTLFSFKNVKGDEVRRLLAQGATDEEIVAWFKTHGIERTPAEIKTWSDAEERMTFHGRPEEGEWFDGECRRLGLDPKQTTLFDYLEADDRASYR